MALSVVGIAMGNYRIRLSTLLWIVTAGCCFLAGQQWHRRGAVMAGDSEIIVIDDGQHHLLTLEKRIPEISYDDTSNIMVTPLSPHELLILAKNPGVTYLNVTTEDEQTTSFRIEVPGPTSVVVNNSQKNAVAEFITN